MREATRRTRRYDARKRGLGADLHRWQVAHIEKGLRQAEAGEFASRAAVSGALARLRKRGAR